MLNLGSHLRAALYSLGKLSRTPLTTFLTCFILGAALSLPAILFVLLKNVENIMNSFQQTTQLTLYLKNSTPETEVEKLLQRFKNQIEIQTATAISPEQGLKELQQQSGFDSILEKLSSNPLPWVIVITPKENFQTPLALEQLSADLKQLPQVESLQMDMLWIKRLAALISLAHYILYALGIFLGTAVLLIINNIIRSVAEQHRDEIEVIKLIGGTARFIRRPFLYAGMFYGLFGGIIAWTISLIFLLFLREPVQTFSILYESHFQLMGLSFSNLFNLLASCLALGLLGSWFAVRRYL